MAQQACTAALTAFVGKEAVKLALNAATAKAAQSRHQRGQGQLARAREGGGEIGVTGRGCKSRAVKVFGQSSQSELDGITVLRKKSCQPQENNQSNQKFVYSTGLSSVDCVLHLAISRQDFFRFKHSKEKITRMIYLGGFYQITSEFHPIT